MPAMLLSEKIAGCSYDELLDKQIQLVALLRDAKTRLKMAQANAASSGEYLPVEEYQELMKRAGRLSVAAQIVQVEIGRRKKSDKKRRAVESEQRFIDACRQELAPELFARLWQQANRSPA